MTRDELIEVGRDAMGRNDGWRWWAPRHLSRLLDVWEPMIRADAENTYSRRWEAIVRADERERNREAEGVELYLATEHAEAVAARLVEVICEMEADAIWRNSGILRRNAEREADLRAQIAADIEALEVRRPWGPAGPDLVSRTDAARISRGES